MPSMVLWTFHLLGSVLCIATNSQPWILASGGILNHSITPSTTHSTQYHSHPAATQNQATVFFNTSVPAVHLGLLLHSNTLKSIDCRPSAKQGFSEISLSFSSEILANSAYSEWISEIPDLAFLTNHELGCAELEAGTFLVKNISRPSPTSLLVITSNNIARRDVVTDWRVRVSQWNVAFHDTSAAGSQEKTTLQKRSSESAPANISSLSSASNSSAINDILAGQKYSFLSDASHSLKPFVHSHSNRSIHYDLTSNYDPEVGAATNPRIILVETMIGAAYCLQCYTRGEADVELILEGRFGVITMYNMTLKGQIDGNFDMQLVLKQEFGMPLVPLLTVPLLPVNIPGVLAIVPEFRLKTGFTYEGWEEVGMTFGANYSIPLHFNVYSKHGILTTPIVTKLSPHKKAVVHPHRIHEFYPGAKYWAAYEFNPYLRWGAEIYPEIMSSDKPMAFQKRSLSTIQGEDIPVRAGSFFMSFDCENVLGYQISAGNLTHCAVERAPVELIHDDGLKLVVVTPFVGKRWIIWRIKNTLKCWFCNEECGVYGISRPKEKPTFPNGMTPSEIANGVSNISAIPSNISDIGSNAPSSILDFDDGDDQWEDLEPFHADKPPSKLQKLRAYLSQRSKSLLHHNNTSVKVGDNRKPDADVTA